MLLRGGGGILPHLTLYNLKITLLYHIEAIKSCGFTNYH